MTFDYAWYDLVGNVGVAAIIIAYFGLQMGWMEARGFWYAVVNLVGAVLILISLLYTFNLSSFVIELFWIGISLIGIVRAIRVRSAKRRVRES